MGMKLMVTFLALLLKTLRLAATLPRNTVFNILSTSQVMGFLGGTAVESACQNAGDTRDVGLIPGWERHPGGGNGNLLQYSCLENPTDRGTWQATVHGITESWTQVSD